MTKRRNVVLFVDLQNVSPWQKARFGKEMADREWAPFHGDEGSAYATMIFGQNSDSSIVRRVTTQMQTVAASCKVNDCEGVCVIEETGPPDLRLVSDSNCS